ncbi:sugar-binding transcriptional regulator [Antarcticirhabdus aurantiaca]|uniref:Sugar-binding transcriptional regulator n=1 Tax=Antarcticirhabdus aurantiaca TaxID=2606717 RepID=A0ACD4NMX0_9HYPH|nr:sugar-binding transcriptional regulator [Antarcticirhabdus aurantiaca]WAJ28099.1 sugar-binding transcriptional regulator [Jeongeuplla avenae]
MARIHDLRLMGRVAQLYYLEKATQADISKRLGISQASISRLLKRAQEEDLVRITIHAPRGTFFDLEAALRERYGLSEAFVVEAGENSEDSILTAIGAATAHFVETSLREGEVIGLSSWSASLLRTVESLHPTRVSAARVIQLLGGTGNPGAEKHATHLTLRMAQITGAKPQLLAAPGLTQSAEARAILIQDPFVRETLSQFKDVTLALVGIGALEPSQMIADSGNRLQPAELRELGEAGAVGDMGLRFFDREGRQVRSSCDERIIGIDLPEIAAIPRVVGVAGGQRKVEAIRAAMLGGFVSILVTDNHTAAALVAD